MKKFAAPLSISLLLLSLASFYGCQSAKTATSSQVLKFNFEKGKSYDYEMIVNMDQEIMGQQMKMDMNSYYSMDVTDDNGNEKTISTTFERIKMNMNMGPVTLDVDSENPIPTDTASGSEMQKALSKMNRLFSSLKGQKFTMKVNAEGKVTEVTGMKELQQRIMSQFGDEITEAQKMQMKDQFNKQFSDDQIKSQFERVLYIFPNKEVKVGDSWTKSSSGGVSMPGKYNSKYTVTEIEGNMVTLKEESTIESSEENTKLTGDITGTIVVDSRSGLVVNSTQNMDMKVESNGMSIGIKGITKVKGKAN